jgi:hypothetical protein
LTQVSRSGCTASTSRQPPISVTRPSMFL